MRKSDGSLLRMLVTAMIIAASSTIPWNNALGQPGGAGNTRTARAEDAASGIPQPPKGLQFTIGNPGVPLLIEAWGPPPGIDLPKDLRAAYNQELDTQLEQASQCKATGIEYYIGWGVAEPTKGHWDWSIYKEAARRIKAKGFRFIPVIWIQNLPRWVRNNPDYPRASNVGTGLSTDSLSIFARETHDSYDRFYGQLQENLGSDIDMIRLNSPYDYGEIAYPNGAASRVFPMKNEGSGFWVNEPSARTNFQSAEARNYGSIAALNQAWHTDFASFQSLDYPTDPSRQRYWLDFIEWYDSALTEETGELIDIARKHFPTTPISFNIGWPFEKLNLGHDVSGLVKMAAEKKVFVRSPTGPAVCFLYSKHIVTAVNFYKPPGFSSEPVDSRAPEKEISLALFKDLTTGVNWHFDYLPNIARSSGQYADYFRLWQPGRYPDIDMAVFFPTTAHRLNDWNSWRGPEPYSGGFPAGLMQFGEAIRGVTDYDVVDERLVQDGALSSYQSLIWPSGDVIEAETLAKIYQWVQRGGILMVNDLSQIKTTDGTRGAFGSIHSQDSSGREMISLGKGYLFDGHGSSDNLLPLVVERGNLKRLDPRYPDRMTSVAPLDATADGVLVSEFADGILLYNRSGQTVTKALTVPVGPWKESYSNIPRSVDVQPYQLTWIDGKTGAVR